MLNEELIYLDMPYSTQNELFEEMSKKLLELGYVNEEYLDALKKREEEFPTGIKTQVAGLAIPHVDSKYIKKAGIAVVRLKKPILFQEMCTNNDVDVNLVFMLLVKDKSKQVTTLSALMGCFSNEEALKQLMTGSKAEIIEELEKILEENE